jgi:hypothetical protein
METQHVIVTIIDIDTSPSKPIIVTDTDTSSSKLFNVTETNTSSSSKLDPPQLIYQHHQNYIHHY